ncbi:GYD domain-containing protein [Geodermatophilus tzadiensis]|uniref:GYD domain-containing protein n=1 Tax=Geodermatophilus tzadiensis TaxID=1137988 RepID=A0A2T0TP78_9ACTN|nr:GYD domain-containing protein [Geodermatophilus tzadiensis]PRY47429.1 GYD domain-containing protein [Geodermatophilus tzadiensis]
MPLYLTRSGYTPETWARLLDDPEDRLQAAETHIGSVGGRLHGFWCAFGPHDGYTPPRGAGGDESVVPAGAATHRTWRDRAGWGR